MTALEELKFNIRESKYPYFSDNELNYLLEKYNNDIELTSYHALIIKTEDDSIKIPDLDYKGTKEYFLKLAQKFRPCMNGIMKRADEVFDE